MIGTGRSSQDSQAKLRRICYAICWYLERWKRLVLSVDRGEMGRLSSEVGPVCRGRDNGWSDFETYVDGGGVRRYSGVWRAGTDGHYLWVGVDWNNFQAKWTQLSNQGLRLTVLRTYVDGNTVRYAGVWRAGTDGHYLWAGVDWNNFNAKWEELSKQNLRLVSFDTCVVGGKRVCTAEPGAPDPTVTTCGWGWTGITSRPSGKSCGGPRSPPDGSTHVYGRLQHALRRSVAGRVRPLLPLG